MTQKKRILITGGCGFIGSSFFKEVIDAGYFPIIFDKLTYAGSLKNIKNTLKEKKTEYTFIQGDICDAFLVEKVFHETQPDAIVHFAAESHVDRSIQGPHLFIQTNIIGTFHLLYFAKNYWEKKGSPSDFRFIHISTDEVFGSLHPENPNEKFSEKSKLDPRSPYSASKAASDCLAKAWYHTYGFPVITTNCSNNYGPRQFPEKLIPRMIFHALQNKPLPIYGKGNNIRDWIHVKDHAKGILLALAKGKPGSTYCFGGNAERTNLEVVHAITEYLDIIKPKKDKTSYKEQIAFTQDRMGHDFRYAIDDSLAQNELGFKREYNFEQGLKETINWYLENLDWYDEISQEKGDL
jgi:dTDP-glucose 4,6-dehydratase